MSASVSPNKYRATLAQRLAIAGAVLLIEYLFFSYLFDARNLKERGGGWQILAYAGELGPLLLVGASAYFLFPQLKKKSPSNHQIIPSVAPLYLFFHTLALGCFFYISSTIFAETETPSGQALAWLGAWLTLGSLTSLSLCAGIFGGLKIVARSTSKIGVLALSVGALAWSAAQLTTLLWQPLAYATFKTVAFILLVLKFHLKINEVELTLELDEFMVRVAPECSGVEGIGLFLVLMTAFLHQTRSQLRFPRAFFLLPLGVGAIWLGNALRIASLMVVGARFDPEVAVNSFHSKVGWIFFCAITLSIAIGARYSSFFSRTSRKKEGANPTTPLVLPLLIWITIGLLSSAWSAQVDPFYFLRVLGAATVLWIYRDHYRVYLQPPSLFAWAVGFLVGLIWFTIVQYQSPGAPASHPLLTSLSPLQFNSWVLLRIIGASIFIPLCEELAFRAFLPRLFTRRDFWKVPFTQISAVGIVASSIAFALVHTQWALAFATGIAYALLLRRRGRLSDPVAAHCASNLVIALGVLVTGNWNHW